MQKFKATAIDETTVTLVPADDDGTPRPEHQGATGIVPTYVAVPRDFYERVDDGVRYLVTIQRVGG